MLQPRPESTKTERVITKEINQLRRRPLHMYGAVMLLAASAGYALDATTNYVEASNANIRVIAHGEALAAENNDNGIIFLNGLGTNNANIIARHQGEAYQHIDDGQLWSVNYNNAPLNSQAVTAKIKAMAERENLQQLSIVGYSAGGNIGLDVAEELILTTDYQVPFIAMVMTPSGIEGLTPASQDGIEMIEAVSHVPGAQYSSKLRFALEMIARRDQYLNSPEKLSKVWTETESALESKSLPAGSVIVDQAFAIANSDIEQSFVNIANAGPDTLRPVIIYLASGKGGYDGTVNNNYSSTKICEAAIAVGLQCLVYEVPKAIHNRPEKASEEYLQTIIDASPEIHNALLQEQELLVQRSLTQP